MFPNVLPVSNKIGNERRKMQFAISKTGERTIINDAIKGEDYFCPCCNGLMTQKKGTQMIWHYAHKSLNNCIDYYDNKGEWHRKMQDMFPEKNREIVENFGMYKHIYDILTDNGVIIEFQHSPLSLDDFKKRTKDYIFRSVFHKTARPIWVFDYTEREFSISPQKYEGNPRRRKFYWKRASNIFGEHIDYKNESHYELWFYISPYERGTKIGEQYGYAQYDKKPKGKGFIKVLGTYNDCKTVVADIYTEEQFYKYITSL